MTVVAEGIEREEQAQHLLHAGLRTGAGLCSWPTHGPRDVHGLLAVLPVITSTDCPAPLFPALPPAVGAHPWHHAPCRSCRRSKTEAIEPEELPSCSRCYHPPQKIRKPTVRQSDQDRKTKTQAKSQSQAKGQGCGQSQKACATQSRSAVPCRADSMPGSMPSFAHGPAVFDAASLAKTPNPHRHRNAASHCAASHFQAARATSPHSQAPARALPRAPCHLPCPAKCQAVAVRRNLSVTSRLLRPGGIVVRCAKQSPGAGPLVRPSEWVFAPGASTRLVARSCSDQDGPPVP